MMKDREDDNRLQLELDSAVAQGEYANFTVVAHSSSEFIIDFARILPAVPKVCVKSRVIMAPEQVKRLMLMLQENVGKYEREFGPIALHGESLLPPVSPVKGEA